MKLSKIIVMVHIAALVCACEKDVEMNPASVENETRTVSDTPARSMLSFESIEQMERQIHLLLEMSPDELEAWYARYDFMSQYDALYRAAEEIDDATTLEQAEAIKEKYSPFFLYDNNPTNENMYNPYLPNENPLYAYVCNINGEVNIGGETVNFNTISDVRDTHEYRLTHSVSTRAVADNITETNMLKRTVGKHKFWAEGHYTAENRYVQIEFTAHKKGTFGWNKCKQNYHIKIDPKYKNHSTYGWEKSGHFVSGYFDGLDAGVFTAAEGTWTGKMASHTMGDIGKIKSGSVAGITIRVYSAGTGEASEGPLNISYHAN